MPRLRTIVAQSAFEMEGLAEVWNELTSTPPYSIFQRFGWNRLAAEIFSDRLRPHVICVDSDSGTAIIPAAINDREQRIEFLGETLFDYRDVLHAGDPEPLQLAWQQLAKLGLPLSICCIDSAGVDRWGGFSLQTFCTAPEVSRDKTNEQQFRLAHSRVGRHFRRLQRQGVEFRQFRGSDSEVVRQLYRRKAEQFAEDATNVFRDPSRREFMIASCALEDDNCDVFTLQSAEGDLVAGIVTFRDGGARRFYTIYFNPAWARFSPGVVLLYEVTARSLAEGLSCDYMTGEYPYKMRFANSSRMLHKLELSASDLAKTCTLRQKVA